MLLGESRDELGGSEYLKTMHGLIRGEAPLLDLAREAGLQKVLVEGAANGIIRSAHDCAEGGLAVTVAECCFDASLGVDVDVQGVGGVAAWRDLATLFGESASRAVVSVSPEYVDRVLAMAVAANVPAARIGVVGGDRIRVSVDGGRVLDESLAAAELIWSTAIENYFERRRAVA